MGENKKGLVVIVRVKMHFKHTEGEVKEVGWEKGVHISSKWHVLLNMLNLLAKHS